MNENENNNIGGTNEDMIKGISKLMGKDDVMNKHYDVGICGWWGHENFGGCLTYYALERAIKSLGYSVLMIQEANGLPGRYKISDTCIAMRHAKANYNCSPQLDYKELPKFNDICDRFVIGGDQMWNYRIHFVKEDCFLNFVNDDKIKISYSTSFGAASHEPTQEYIEKMAPLLKRFDAISVREDYAARIAESKYNAHATEIVDAVFLPDVQEYINLINQADVELPKKYLLAFILNPSEEKRRQIEAIAKKMDLEILMVPDAAKAQHELFNKIFDGLNIMSPLSVANFIKAYYNASYVVTDSFHGTCMSYVFKKDFNVYYNKLRGTDRFISLMKMLKLDSRRIYETNTDEEIRNNENIAMNVKWGEADANVKAAKEFAFDWLKKALSTKKNSKYPSEIIKMDEKQNVKLIASPSSKVHDDIKRCRMLASLLRDYKIRHIVVSSGTRHIELVRLFEANDCFITHDVVDERSAGFYAIGLATKLGETVAVCCTSGTASSNYLSSATEAFYQHIPIIYITADRYPHLLNQREEQMVPQDNMYGSVCLKSITLPTKEGPVYEAVSRRMICETILEATHGDPGPVHINIPIGHFDRTRKADSEYFIDKIHYIRVMRHKLTPDRSDWYDPVSKLSSGSRILVLYGQRRKLNDNELDALESFSKKTNSVILVDHTSNVRSAKSIYPYNFLKNPGRLTAENIAKIKPDIVITVNGAHVHMGNMNIFLSKCGQFAHWEISESGTIADPFKKISRVFECSDTQFFKRVKAMVTKEDVSDSYYKAWKDLEIKDDPVPDSYSQKYAIYRILKTIPAHSLLHIANSRASYLANCYQMDPTVEVFSNRGTKGIDGSTSSFMGQVAVNPGLSFLIVGDLSFFYDMNSLWNKKLSGNIRILMINNSGAGLIKFLESKSISHEHKTTAEGWVTSLGFTYLSSRNKEEYEANLTRFTSTEDTPMFFEVFTD